MVGDEKGSSSAAESGREDAPTAAQHVAGWLPIVLCPTDGVDRALLLPDGREIVGAFHNPGGWQYAETLTVDEPVYEIRRTGFLSHHNPKRSRDPDRVQVGTRKRPISLIGKLPEGVYPTHFRPNDTVWGKPRPPAEIYVISPSEASAGTPATDDH